VAAEGRRRGFFSPAHLNNRIPAHRHHAIPDHIGTLSQSRPLPLPLALGEGHVSRANGGEVLDGFPSVSAPPSRIPAAIFVGDDDDDDDKRPPPLSIMENPHPQGMTPDGRQSAITHRIL